MKKIVNNTDRDIWYDCEVDVETWHVDYDGDWHCFESLEFALSFAENTCTFITVDADKIIMRAPKGFWNGSK